MANKNETTTEAKTAEKKTTQTAEAGKEVKKTLARSVAEKAMKRAGVTTVYGTADGTMFILESDALNYAATLKDQTVTTYNQ